MSHWSIESRGAVSYLPPPVTTAVHGSLTLLVIIFSMLSFLAVSVFLFLVTHKLLANIHFAFWLFSVDTILYITCCVYTGTQNIYCSCLMTYCIWWLASRWRKNVRACDNCSFDICCSVQAPIKCSLNVWFCSGVSLFFLVRAHMDYVLGSSDCSYTGLDSFLVSMGPILIFFCSRQLLSWLGGQDIVSLGDDNNG